MLRHIIGAELCRDIMAGSPQPKSPLAQGAGRLSVIFGEGDRHLETAVRVLCGGSAV